MTLKDINLHKPYDLEFYGRETPEVAKSLLGSIFVRMSADFKLAARIVETEAYVPHDDPANHSSVGKTPRNAIMHEEGGVLYVYKIYGIHHCVNVVTEDNDKGCAVLIRAAEPLAGVDIMKENRKVQDIRKLCKGPGNFAKAFGISMEHNKASLVNGEFAIYPDTYPQEIVAGPRIGISKAKELPYRFYYAGNEFVSAKKLK